ncbi:signal peptidase I [Candidatus Epulonipiscioides gigas]|nr:signal peptidase I [Epulopiscium sp. SCG-C07WGA-EpuloA2]
MQYKFKVIKVIVSSLGLLTMITLGLQVYIVGLIVVNQSSMNPTLFDGDILITNKFIYKTSAPQVNDIIILYKDTPKGLAKTRLGLSLEDLFAKILKNDERIRYVKRIIAVEGDIVDIKNGKLFVNNKEIVEDFILGNTYTNDAIFPIEIDKGNVYVLGDNREISLDSRNFGQVPINMIESRVELILPWQSASSTYENE